MNWLLQRLFYTKDYTAGHLTNGQTNFFCLEDTYREFKIAAETRIPAGKYELKLMEQNTPLTMKHRKSYQTPWFKANPGWFHIHLQNVPNYTGVYVHSGNTKEHTMGCLLPAYTINMLTNSTSNSLLATDKFYSLTYPLINKGVRCFIDIRDELKF